MFMEVSETEDELFELISEVHFVTGEIVDRELRRYDNGVGQKPMVAVVDNHWLLEQVKTVRNLCNTVLLIPNDRPELLVTLLELMYVEAQDILDQYCVVKLD